MKRNSRCKDCIHRERFSGGGRDYWMCNYLLDEEKPRPCPADDKCTEFKKGKPKKRNWSIQLAGSTPLGREYYDH